MGFCFEAESCCATQVGLTLTSQYDTTNLPLVPVSVPAPRPECLDPSPPESGVPDLSLAV